MSKYAGYKNRTELKRCIAGESMARNKYTFYASAAKKAGYERWLLYIWKLLTRRKSMPDVV